MVDDDAEAEFLEIVLNGSTNVSFDPFGLEIQRATRHARSVTEAIVHRTDVNVVVDQAAYVDDPLAQFKFSGSAFLISGIDVNLEGTPGPNAPVPGIGTPGDPEWIRKQLKKNQLELIQGAGGRPSVMTVDEVDLTAQMTQYASLATQVWSGADEKYGGDIGDLEHMHPVIAHAKGHLSLYGNTKGCGILIVNGDLTVNGSFDFVGLIYAGGAVTFNGGGGGKNLRGALFTLGAVTGPDLLLNGSVQIRYSSEALTTVSSRLTGALALVSWIQR